MKKTVKKLALSRETLSSLTRDAVRKAVGGDPTWVTCADCTRISYCDLCMPWE